MTFAENTTEDVWQSLGPAKYLLGRERVKALTEACVRSWPHELMSQTLPGRHQQLLAETYADQIAAEQYGSLLAMFFVGLVSAVVQVLLRWWIDRNWRMKFAAWTLQLRASEAKS